MAAHTKARTPNRTMKAAIGVTIAVGVLGASAFLASGGLTAMRARPGFLGTPAALAADVNLVAQVVLLAGLALGSGLARMGHEAAHQYNQTGWVLFSIVLTAFIMIGSFAQAVVPGLPGDLGQPYAAISAIHAALGAVALTAGVYIILRMNRVLPPRWRVAWWKNLMRAALAIYLAVGLLGVATYYAWYVG
jgi:hypothetical protein